MKKTLAILVVLVIALAIPVLATTAVEPLAPAKFIAAYEGGGVVEIDFPRNVRYDNLTVTAAEAFGDAQIVTILERDDDDLTFRIENAKDETVYTFTVSGVDLGEGVETLTGEIATPAAGHTVIQSIEKDDGNLEIDLMEPVAYENPVVTLTDSTGAAVNVTIVETDDDGIEIRTGALTPGEEYTVTITGVGLRGSGVSASVSRSFIAR